MMQLTLLEAAEACGGKLVCRVEEDAVRCISCAVTDSRQVQADGLFFAVCGERVDGHRFISQVFAKGAAAVVTQKTPAQVQEESGEDCSAWGSYILVEDTLQALKAIAECYRIKVGIPVVGITGSVGKTSTKEFIAGVLSERFCVLKTEGNFNNEIGVPLTLLRIRPEHELAVVEMGISDFGEMHRLSKMARPNVCVMTNIGQCHMEQLKTRDGILKAKSEIFDYMASDGEIVLNGEDDKLSTLREIRGHHPHYFGLGGNPAEEVFAETIESHGLFGSEIVLNLGGTRRKVQVPLPGIHMVINAACAACVGKLFGMTGEEIASGIAKIKPVSGRNHLIPGAHYTLIDDCYNANPGSMKAALDLLSLADTKKIAILGDMFELGENSDFLHAEVGRYAVSKQIDSLICVGENSLHMFEEACDYAEGTEHIAHFRTLDALLAVLQEEQETYLAEGATILLKASHGMQFDRLLSFLQERNQPA